MRTGCTRESNFATLFDVIAQSGMTTADAALTVQLVGSDDIVDDSGAGISLADMNPLEDDIAESDQRLKTDICKVGTTVYGLPLYRFRYKGQEAVYEGVMAQDVAQVMPSAVLKGDDGFLRVRYGSLGISMRPVA